MLGHGLILLWHWLGTVIHPFFLPLMSGQTRLMQIFKIIFLLLIILALPIYLIRAENKLLQEPTKVNTIGRSTILATLFPNTLQEEYFVESSYTKVAKNNDSDKLAVQPSALQARDQNDDIAWVNYNDEDISLLVRPNGLNTKSNQLAKVTKYTVQFGDTPSTIAQRFGLKIQTLLDNNAISKNMIRVGQTLWLPPTDGLIVTWTNKTTLAALAKKYKVTSADILRANNLGSKDIIVLNERIVIPGARPEKAMVPTKIAKTTALVASRARAGGSNALLWPTTVSQHLTQYFSLRHSGIDIAGPLGTPIYAAANGIVTVSRSGWNGGYGNYIIINHGNGKETTYGHMSRRLVAVGEEVTRGQLIAYMGSTGRSTGSHLHFEVRIFKRATNPFSSL